MQALAAKIPFLKKLDADLSVVAWMKSVEDQVTLDDGFELELARLVPFKTGESQCWYDLRNSRVYPTRPDTSQWRTRRVLRTKGGIIANDPEEQTIPSVLALMQAHPGRRAATDEKGVLLPRVEDPNTQFAYPTHTTLICCESRRIDTWYHHRSLCA
jgi:hypothetical protein